MKCASTKRRPKRGVGKTSPSIRGGTTWNKRWLVMLKLEYVRMYVCLSVCLSGFGARLLLVYVPNSSNICHKRKAPLHIALGFCLFIVAFVRICGGKDKKKTKSLQLELQMLGGHAQCVSCLVSYWSLTSNDLGSESSLTFAFLWEFVVYFFSSSVLREQQKKSM